VASRTLAALEAMIAPTVEPNCSIRRRPTRRKTAIAGNRIGLAARALADAIPPGEDLEPLLEIDPRIPARWLLHGRSNSAFIRKGESMSPNLVRILIAIVILAHGIGHVLGVMAGFGVQLTPKHSAQSWLLTKLLGEGISKGIAVILFAVALLAFSASGLALFKFIVPFSAWSQYAVIASILSTVGLALFPRAFPTMFPNVIGALAVNAAVLLSVWWVHLPAELFAL